MDRSCAILAQQLDSYYEHLVLCDSPINPVAVAPPSGLSNADVDIVPVGDPEHCSGKANALGVGLERANDDLVVLTDDDVERDACWLARLKRLARRHGAAAATPVFVNTHLRWQLLEPLSIVFGFALLYWLGGVWDGSVAFQRDRIDESRFRADLQRTVSDDALLWSMLDTVYTMPSFVSTVRVPGSSKQVRDRAIRFVLTYRYFLPRGMIVPRCFRSRCSP